MVKRVGEHILGSFVSRIEDAAKDDVEEILLRNGVNFPGKKVLSAENVQHIFSSLRENNYYVSCGHETFLWWAHRNNIELSFEKIVETMKVGKPSNLFRMISTTHQDFSNFYEEFLPDYNCSVCPFGTKYTDLMGGLYEENSKYIIGTENHIFYFERNGRSCYWSKWRGNSTSFEPFNPDWLDRLFIRKK